MIGQLEVPRFTYRPPERSYKSGPPRAKKDAKCNYSSLVPRSNIMVTVAIIILNQLETLSKGLYTFN